MALPGIIYAKTPGYGVSGVGQKVFGITERTLPPTGIIEPKEIVFKDPNPGKAETSKEEAKRKKRAKKMLRLIIFFLGYFSFFMNKE